jgi:hypothetical protein
MSRPDVLDTIKRHEICALLACGASRREAADYVGCAPATIANTARRDPDFAHRIEQAERRYDLRQLRAINQAALHSWRAAAWSLENLRPEMFAPPVRRRGLAAPHGALPRRQSIGASTLDARARKGQSRKGGSQSRKGEPRSRAPSAAFTRGDAFLTVRQAAAIAQLDPELRNRLLCHFVLLSDPSLAAIVEQNLPICSGETESIPVPTGPSLCDGDPRGEAAGTAAEFSPHEAFLALQQAVAAAGLDPQQQDRVLFAYSIISDPTILAIVEQAPPICSVETETIPEFGGPASRHDGHPVNLPNDARGAI